MTRKRSLVLALACLCAATPAGALTINYAGRVTGADELDGPRDFGLAGGTSNNVGVFNISPRLQVEITPKLYGYFRARAFLPTSNVEPVDNGLPAQQREVKQFAALDEFWLDYRGLTNYPGESLRIGRQLIRQDDGLWIAQQADALRYLFDTTLLTVDVGAIRQFSTYRTDHAPVYGPQRDRLYGFAGVSGDWIAGHRIGVRVIYGADQKGPPEPGTVIQADTKLQDIGLTWIGLHGDNGYFEPQRPGTLVYRADFNYLTGSDTRDARREKNGILFAGRQDHGTRSAFAGSYHLRLQPLQFPLMFGVSFTYSEGGNSHQYEQSGLQGNASYFTGTPTLISLYNEAFRAEQGNLLAFTGFVSMNLPNDDASLVFSHFIKDKGDGPIVTDYAVADQVNDSRKLGDGIDLVLTHYFDLGINVGNLLGVSEAAHEGNRFLGRERSSLRLRASEFLPGHAYGSGTRPSYRVVAEVTLWVN